MMRNWTRHVLVVAVAVGGFLALVDNTSAQIVEKKITASDGVGNDLFGWSTSINGDYAIVGAYGNDDHGSYSGSAYVFERGIGGTWTEKSKLTASDGTGSDWFGRAVSISGDYAIVGAIYDNDNGSQAGSAYIFERGIDGTWTEKTKLLADDGAAGDNFGGTLSLSGDYAILGTGMRDDDGNNSGAAYVFERGINGTWTQKAKLRASDAAAGDVFGASVAISGDYAVIGAYGDIDHGYNTGSAYIFERDTDGIWIEKTKLLASDGALMDRFGCSAAISGNRTIVGARSDDPTENSAYVFERGSDGTWTEAAKLTGSDASGEHRFADSVSISGDHAIVGDQYHGGISWGAAYVFQRGLDGMWTEKTKLVASDVAMGDQFGGSVSIDGSYAIIGAAWDDDNGSVSGSAYIYENVPEPATLGMLALGGLALVRRRRGMCK